MQKVEQPVSAGLAFLAPVFFGEKMAAGFGAAAVGNLDRRGSCLALGLFVARFRPSIMAKRPLPISAPAPN